MHPGFDQSGEVCWPVNSNIQGQIATGRVFGSVHGRTYLMDMYMQGLSRLWNLFQDHQKQGRLGSLQQILRKASHILTIFDYVLAY